MLVSHSQDFLNGVCTNIIHLNGNRLQYYGVGYIPRLFPCLWKNNILKEGLGTSKAGW